MGTTTTKVDLVNAIAHKTGLTKNETESVVNCLFESIIDSLKAGKRIEIRGFGSFNIRHKNLRQARNPRTGEKVTVDPKNVPAFKISRELFKWIPAKHAERGDPRGSGHETDFSAR